MAGSSFVGGMKSVKADIAAVRSETNGSGVGGSDNSKIGGSARMGADANGSLVDPPYTRIDTEVVGKAMNGLATGGTTGYEFGYGRTFKK